MQVYTYKYMHLTTINEERSQMQKRKRLWEKGKGEMMWSYYNLKNKEKFYNQLQIAPFIFLNMTKIINAMLQNPQDENKTHKKRSIILTEEM